MELGLGIHGEAGVKRMNLGSAKDSIKNLLDHMTNSESVTHLPVAKGEEVVVLLNNLGS